VVRIGFFEMLLVGAIGLAMLLAVVATIVIVVVVAFNSKRRQ
jgi:hypothetical protein